MGSLLHHIYYETCNNFPNSKHGVLTSRSCVRMFGKRKTWERERERVDDEVGRGSTPRSNLTNGG